MAVAIVVASAVAGLAPSAHAAKVTASAHLNGTQLAVTGKLTGVRGRASVVLQRRVVEADRRGRARSAWRFAGRSGQTARRRYRVTATVNANLLPMTVRVRVRAGGRTVATSRAIRIKAPVRGAGSDVPRVVPPEPKPPLGPQAPEDDRSDGTVSPSDTLPGGQWLNPGQRLRSASGRYELVMQYDGNLVLYRPDRTVVWATYTMQPGNRAVMQHDGNLVVTGTDGAVRFSSVTADFDGAEMRLQDDGNLVIYHHGRAIWTYTAGYMGHRLYPGATLRTGAYLMSPSHTLRLIMQSDGNLVLYRQDRSAAWSTDTMQSGNWAVMQDDGNLVVYGADRTPRFTTSTADFGRSELVLQDDGNLVVQHLGRPVWSYGRGYLGDTLLPGHTLNPGQYLLSGDHGHRLFMQGDGNLVFYRPDRTAAWASNTIQPGNRTVMQADGNLVVYGGPTPRFSTGTDGHPGALLRAQNDGNLVIYDGATALWDRHTGRIGAPGPPAPNERGQAIVTHAAAYEGTIYCLGRVPNLLGHNPCVDCSALTQIAVYRAIGLLLPRTSNAQYADPAGRPVAR